MDTQDYLEIKITVSSEDFAEIIEAEAAELAFDSFMYEDGTLSCYIQTDEYKENAFARMLKDMSEMLGEEFSYSAEKMPSVNWNASWEREGFTPIVVDGEVTIMPSGSISSTKISIELAPQMAFGTGHHHTTYMMMQTMLALRDEIRGGSVMDLGCGTAVLAILAAKLGAAKVYGIDIDAVATRSALDNVHQNGLDFPVLTGNARNLEKDAYDFLLANIHRNIIIADLPLYAEAVKAGGRLLLSGFYESDAQDVTKAAEEAGFEFMVPGRTREGWCCLQLVRK